jgi:hypothetical protein
MSYIQDSARRTIQISWLECAEPSWLRRRLLYKDILGKVKAYVYVIEFQKRGLPHAHWLLIMQRK